MTSGPGSDYGTYEPARFSVSLALSRAIEVLFGNFFTIFGISALASVPIGVYVWLEHNGMRSSGTGFVVTLLNAVLSALSEAMIVFATFQALRRRGINPGESIARGLQRFWPVIGASLLVGIITGIGFLLLIVPGLVALCVWYVTIPACVVEQLGPTESMSRSSDLTSGYRWPIFGAALLVGIVQVGGNALINASLRRPGTLVAYAVVYFLWIALVRAYESVLSTIIYHDLRVAKEGIDIEQLASVFD
ncbi:MAG TPA: hypothetical protein VHS78_05120 [Candidatus Elarobacter sp.]|jgi:hypothetical protein|nr:hypothetical protein [Candidatus Elarobacter sp.]